MIYFDNAATGGFKPSAVYLSAEYAIKFLSANPGRSSHKLAILSEEFVFRTRKFLSKSFNNRLIDRVIFTKNCTEALNTAIFGLVKKGSKVITTATEHNSVLRPLYYLKRQNYIDLEIIEPQLDRITEKDILPRVTKNTSLVVINAVSNVTGKKNEYEEIGKKLDCPLLVDGAQAVGHIPIDLKRDNINVLAIAGHKGLCGIPGSGVLIFDETVEIQPHTFGGSGTESFSEMPSCYPELLESGSLNLPAICSMYDGGEFALGNLTQSAKRLTANTMHIIDELEKMGATIYSQPNPSGIVAFSLDIPSVEASDILSNEFDIAVRGGFHCAPLMHRFLQTEENGLIRASLAVQNTEREIEKFLKAVRKMIV